MLPVRAYRGHVAQRRRVARMHPSQAPRRARGHLARHSARAARDRGLAVAVPAEREQHLATAARIAVPERPVLATIRSRPLREWGSSAEPSAVTTPVNPPQGDPRPVASLARVGPQVRAASLVRTRR